MKEFVVVKIKDSNSTFPATEGLLFETRGVEGILKADITENTGQKPVNDMVSYPPLCFDSVFILPEIRL